MFFLRPRAFIFSIFAAVLALGIVLSGSAAPNDSPCDSDRDGLSNAFEKRLGTDKKDPDTDDDGLDDGDEVQVYGTIPYDGDSDDDGLLDGDEVAGGTDPLDPNSP